MVIHRSEMLITYWRTSPWRVLMSTTWGCRNTFQSVTNFMSLFQVNHALLCEAPNWNDSGLIRQSSRRKGKGKSDAKKRSLLSRKRDHRNIWSTAVLSVAIVRRLSYGPLFRLDIPWNYCSLYGRRWEQTVTDMHCSAFYKETLNSLWQ